MKIGYRDVWKLKAYRWNLIAGMIGRLGDSIDMIGFSWMMYGLTKIYTLYSNRLWGKYASYDYTAAICWCND